MTEAADRRLRRLLWLARGAVLWERAWPRAWPAVTLAGVFVSLALLDVLPSLPGWLHAIVLAAFAVGALLAIVHALPGLRPIDRPAAARRLEQDSALAHRPLSAGDDELAAGRGDAVAEAMWQRHRQTMAAVIADLRLRWPFADLGRHEPWGIRAGVVLLLVVGLAAGAGDARSRLARALNPHLSFEAGVGRALEVWVTPPAYTRQAPLFLNAASNDGKPGTEAVPLPVGSGILARASGVDRAPQLRIGDQTSAFAPFDAAGGGPAAFRAEATVESGDRLAIVDGRRALAAWPIRVIPDLPPNVDFAEPPAAAGNGLLSIAFRAGDDYGVTAVSAVVRRAEPLTAAGEEVSLPLSVAAAEPTTVGGGGLHDLARHPWAGMAVRLHLIASDALGQTGQSAPVELILPERQFSHPVAKAIIAERKRLNDGATMRAMIAAALTAIAADTPAYQGDVVVALALDVARARLVHDYRPAAIDQVRDLLWDTALRVEEGNVPAAERELAEARQRLLDALARNAPDAEIERAMEAMKQALDHYLAEVAAELERRGESAEPLDPQAPLLQSQDLQDMLEMARQLARAGAREGAQQLLAEMQRLLDGLRAGLSMRAPQQAMAEARALMEALRQLRDRQQSLLDQTFQQMRAQRERQERNGQPGPANRPAPGATEQRKLRQDLGALLAPLHQLLGGLPSPLAEADQGMRGAGASLDAGRLGEALAGQGTAVDALDRAINDVGEAMAQQLGGGLRLSNGNRPNGGDPFGRRSAGGQRGFADERIKIPDQSEMRRVGEILNELRRRAGDPERPAVEREYIERLLRRF